MTKKEVNESIFSLNYVSGQLKYYGVDNDYDKDLVLKHLEEVIERIRKDLLDPTEK